MVRMAAVAHNGKSAHAHRSLLQPLPRSPPRAACLAYSPVAPTRVCSARALRLYDGQRGPRPSRWIGNAAEDGRWATVFARLRIPSDGKRGFKDHGVHAFICRIREEDGTPSKGVDIRDCGYKVGLNGVDNGALAFHGVRIPREALLDRFGQARVPLPLAPRGLSAAIAAQCGT